VSKSKLIVSGDKHLLNISGYKDIEGAVTYMHDPFQGIGKPEPLKFLSSGVWSRRITQEHRLVYVVGHKKIDFIQARYHY
jgi:toxin YoeB